MKNNAVSQKKKIKDKVETRDLCKKIDKESHGNFLSAVCIVVGLPASTCICYSNWTSNKMVPSTLLVLFRNLKTSKSLEWWTSVWAYGTPLTRVWMEKIKNNLMPKRNVIFQETKGNGTILFLESKPKTETK
jgi:hypothetical protein